MEFLRHIKTKTVLRCAYVLPMLILISEQIPVAKDWE